MRYEDWDQIVEDLVENVSGIGEGSAGNLREDFSLPGFHLACKETYHDDETWRFKTVSGIGEQTAQRIATYAFEVREIDE